MVLNNYLRGTFSPRGWIAGLGIMCWPSGNALRPLGPEESEGAMLNEEPTCALSDCDVRAVMHVRHAEVGYRGECFCSWEHLIEYAHVAAQRDAVRHWPLDHAVLPGDSAFNELSDWARVRSQHAEHFIS
jgi:hypothetical protein